MHKMLKKFLFCSLLLTGSLFASKNILQFEIVPFDYVDEGMKEQLCAMVRDDQEIQKRIRQTPEKFLKNLLDHELQYIICRSKENKSDIYGFMTCMQFATFYCYQRSKGLLITRKYYEDRFPLIEIMKSVGYIQDMAVHKDLRGHGIAQHLLHSFEETCKQVGVHKLMIRVAADNAQAISAYNKAGFLIDHAYDHDEHHYTMFKKIT